jgi:hypothetical protein
MTNLSYRQENPIPTKAIGIPFLSHREGSVLRGLKRDFLTNTDSHAIPCDDSEINAVNRAEYSQWFNGQIIAKGNIPDCSCKLLQILTGSTEGDLETCSDCDGKESSCFNGGYMSCNELSSEQIDYLLKLERKFDRNGKDGYHPRKHRRANSDSYEDGIEISEVMQLGESLRHTHSGASEEHNLPKPHRH